MCIAAAVIGGVATIGGALISSNAAGNAAQDQQQAAQSAQQLQQQEFNTVQQETAPQRALGVGATGLLANLYGLPNPVTGAPATAPNYSGFENSPGYQFSVQQANQATNRAAAAGGNLYSTSTLQTLGQNNAGYASQQYGNYVNQLLAQAGLGQASTNTSAAAGTNMANQSGAAAIYAGNAAANGSVAQGQAYNNMLSSLTGSSSGLFGNNSGTGAFQPYGAFGADTGDVASGNLSYAQQVAAGF